MKKIHPPFFGNYDVYIFVSMHRVGHFFFFYWIENYLI